MPSSMIKMRRFTTTRFFSFDLPILFAATISLLGAADVVFRVQPLSPEIAAEYKLDPAFYKKCTQVQGILIG